MIVSRTFVVGIISIVAFVLILGITVSLRQWDFLSKRDTYYVKFPQVAALDVGAPVQLAGIPVGTVGEMKITDDPQYPALISLRIRKNIPMYSSATVQIVPAAVIGNTTINIFPGRPGPGISQLHPGATLTGQMPPQIQDILSNASTQINDVSTELIGVLKGVNSFISDPANQARIRQMLTNLAAASGKANQTLDLVNQEVMPLATTLKKTSARLDSFLQNAQELTDQASENITQTGESLRQTSGAFSKTAGDFSAAAQTLNGEIKANSAKLRSVLDQIDSTLAANKEPLTQSILDIDKATRSLNDVLQMLHNGEGTLGRLLTDPRPFEELRQILAGLSATLTGRRESVFPVQPANAGPRPKSIFPTSEPKPLPTPGARPSIAPEGGPHR